MKITHIHVTAARGFNHPHEQYANFKFDLHLQAALEDGEDPAEALALLQQRAEHAAETHKARILDDVERLRLIKRGEEMLAHLKRQKKQQEEVDPQIAECEAALAKLTSTPLMLCDKVIHAGHPDHPDTDEDDPFVN